MGRLILWVGSGAGALWLGMALQTEFERHFLWYEAGSAYFMFVLCPLIVATVAVARALADQVVLHPTWLRSVTVGLGMLLVGLGGAWGVRAGSDWWTLRSWHSWDVTTQVWLEDYSERYRLAVLEMARREATRRARTDELLGRTEGDPPRRSWERNPDPAAFDPEHPPDLLKWRVWRVRAGRYAHNDVLVGVVTVKWRSAPFPYWDRISEQTRGQRHRSVEVREVLQWADVGDEIGWQRIGATVRLGDPF